MVINVSSWPSRCEGCAWRRTARVAGDSWCIMCILIMVMMFRGHTWGTRSASTAGPLPWQPGVGDRCATTGQSVVRIQNLVAESDTAENRRPRLAHRGRLADSRSSHCWRAIECSVKESLAASRRCGPAARRPCNDQPATPVFAFQTRSATQARRTCSSIQPPGVATLRSSCSAERGDWPVHPRPALARRFKGVSQEVVRLIAARSMPSASTC